MSSGASSRPAADGGAFFDERAERYDRAYDARGADGYALRSRMAAVLRLLGNGPGDVLDAGMGPGRLLAELAARDWTVSGIDASREMVIAARRRLPSSAERLLEAEIEALPFPDASFDGFVATGVLEYADLESALREAGRVLRPGGLAVVSYPNPSAWYGGWKTRAWYPTVRAAKRIGRRPPLALPRGSRLVPPPGFHILLAGAGLECFQRESTSYLAIPSPLDQLLPRAAERLGVVLDRRGARFARVLATQVVYAARRR